MGHLSSYIENICSSELQDSILSTSSELYNNILNKFRHSGDFTGLLLGNVQSGKTGQVLGFISKMADEGYKIFIFLTTDNVDLQRQTFNRVNDSLKTFCVLSEKDEVRFTAGRKPIVIVLKKNSRVLRKWRDILLNSNACKGQSLVIVDDEGDASSLNTLVNRNRVSTINNILQQIKNTAHAGTIYLEVTATPQAIILQSTLSNWKPSFITYFKPGKDYLGGNFFYSDPKSYCIKITNEDELSAVLEDDDNVCPQGLQESIASFLVNCAHKLLNGKTNCNFMIHPSVRIAHHRKFVQRVQEQLNLLQNSIDEQDFTDTIRDVWADLQKTKPDLEHFDDILSKVKYILNEELILTIPLNSQSFVCRDSTDPNALKLDKNFNIVVGGNTLGRGITFPNLQTVYYCRNSNSPQADTFWQHSRIFGYDREKELVRIYIPKSLHQLFCDLNKSNEMLINQVVNNEDNIQLIFPKGINPTRKNVLDNKYLNFIYGGINIFPSNPIQSNTTQLDPLIRDFSNMESTLVELNEILNILSYVGSISRDEFNSEKFKACIMALNSKRPQTKYRLIVRDNRDISFGTGTLLSPTDRKLGESFKNDVVLTLYRVKGEISKGWNGSPLWIPNIKFPDNTCYYDTLDIEE